MKLKKKKNGWSASGAWPTTKLISLINYNNFIDGSQMDISVDFSVLDLVPGNGNQPSRLPGTPVQVQLIHQFLNGTLSIFKCFCLFFHLFFFCFLINCLISKFNLSVASMGPYFIPCLEYILFEKYWHFFLNFRFEIIFSYSCCLLHFFWFQAKWNLI